MLILNKTKKKKMLPPKNQTKIILLTSSVDIDGELIRSPEHHVYHRQDTTGMHNNSISRGKTGGMIRLLATGIRK